MDIFKELGRISLGTRVRYLSDRLSHDAAKIFNLYDVVLKPKWFPVYFSLAHKPEPQTVTSIAKEISQSHASVSKIVSEMFDAGLISTQPDPIDKRKSMITLSQEGLLIADKINYQYSDIGTALDQISSQTKHDLWKALEEWDYLLQEKSLFKRITEVKKNRESQLVKIENYKPQHQESFFKLNENWIKTYFKMEEPDKRALSDPQKNIIDKGGFIFVAKLNQEVIGVCALIKRKDSKYPYELAKMAVTQKARGKKVGWKLSQAVIEKARELGSTHLFLESNTQLRPAIKLYKKLGFKKVIGPDTPYERSNIQMELKL